VTTVKIPDLETLYHDELKDAYDFEHQILEALPQMAEAAHSDELRQAFEEHQRQTEGQVERLEQVFRLLGKKAARKHCDGMEGLIDEGEDILEAEGDEAAIDAALIAAAQRVEHYEMAAYGTLRTFARTLGYDDQAELLQQTLDEEGETDELLTQLAESGLNQQAADGSGRRQGQQARGGNGSAGDEKTKEELYEEAKRQGVEGRSKMDKQELERAVGS
jgi:ferritin-like metal-binding protein YciE